MMKAKGHKARLGLALAALAAVALLPGSATSAYISSSRVDWPKGTVILEAKLDLGAAGIRLPSGRLEAERLLDTAAPSLAMQTVLHINLDSYRSVNDALTDGSLGIADLNAYLDTWVRSAPVLSKDGSSISAVYEWSLPKLAALFVRHSVPVSQRDAEGYTPSRPYTGIIVYAQGMFPVRGEHGNSGFTPCLYPRLYDERMEAVLERNLMAPDALRFWGPVAYAYSMDDPVVELRAGNDPLRIMPTQVFGSLRTDAVISFRDAQRILASEENHELIRTGRVVFVLDQSAQPKP